MRDGGGVLPSVMKRQGKDKEAGFNLNRDSSVTTCRGKRWCGGGGGFTFNRASSVTTELLGFPCLPGTCTGAISCTATPLLGPELSL